MKLFAKFSIIAAQLLICFISVQSSHAISMSDLRKMPNLTPQAFARQFATYEFKFHTEVQNYETFLKSKSGDCDDFATVASTILAERGYTPRMIAVRMKGETHVICYIQEVGGYLDYNMRKEANPIVPCSPTITDIAAKVARSFSRDWIATYEFTYDARADVKRLVDNIIPNPEGTQMAAAANNTAQAGAKPAKK